jgi:ATP-dependent DNA helicase RecQ
MLQRVHHQFPERDFILRVYNTLGNWLGIGIASGLDHTFPFPFEQFCADNKLPLLPTFSAIQILQQAGYLTYIDEHETQPQVQILLTREDLYDTHLPPTEEHLLNALMRLHPGIFTEPAYIFEDRLCEVIRDNGRLKSRDNEKQQLNHLLITLAQQGLIRYIPRRKTPYIHWPQERLQLEYVRIPESCYEVRRERYERQIQAMLKYASLSSVNPESMNSKSVTPEAFLLNYFGEK